MKRREFLETAIAGATAMIAAGQASANTAPPAAADTALDPFAKVKLGNSGLTVSRTGMGSGMWGHMRRSNQTRLGDVAFHDLWRYGYDRGIRYYDMADLYGSHQDIMPALKGVPREEFTMVTKIWWREGNIPELERLDADVLVERFLREIKTDYIDLVHLHCVTEADWPQKLARYMDSLDKLKEQGKIRAHGVSVHALDGLRVAAEHPWVDAVHTRINPFGVKMDGKPEEVVPILEKMHANGKGVTGMKIIGEGAFRNDREKRLESIRFVMGLKCVDTVIVGFEKKEEVDDFHALATEALKSLSKS